MNATTFHASWFVKGVPKPQPRPRAFSVNGKARMYDCGTAEHWKQLVAVGANAYAPESPLDCPIAVHVTFYLPRPKSKCRLKDFFGAIWCLSKPDCDNLAKAVLDCLTQEGWWVDDSRVCVLDVRKKFHEKKGSPGMAIQVYEMPELPND